MSRLWMRLRAFGTRAPLARHKKLPSGRPYPELASMERELRLLSVVYDVYGGEGQGEQSRSAHGLFTHAFSCGSSQRIGSRLSSMSREL